MVKFRFTARQVRSFNNEESEVKVLEKQIEEMMEHIMKLQDDQKELKTIFSTFKEKLEST